ncbi:MFS general substrate transporter [Dothidotthia symphoricarpi CBS 119687]|uniref:MFS general substrate transporter n=1 Tax=Dothidotthia symphoricarpi CBS 119687 TaxID=1392245 RepID=A0A6A6A2X1_9PLEO|nr:MFS general substrate transporter [Dothidotthia symphoricarpi CBS 119687]KAF2125896.1 MFS general substrate transporter [Dothidotthia symphoricarpi CBS 119687]
MGGADIETAPQTRVSEDAESLKAPTKVGREELADIVPPHDAYEGRHRFDPHASWTAAEERRVVLKTDLHLLAWLCIMMFALQLDRGSLSNALADNLLKDLNLTSDDYNNGTTIQLLCFLAAEFPVQFLTKRYGFKWILPSMMVAWGTVSWAQAFMHDRTSFYLARAALGLCEGGFIPGVVLFATYFYTSKELSIRLAAFWSSLNVARVISALLAAGILEMRGVGGKPGWFWLFVLEGLLTLLIAGVSYVWLPESPTSTKTVLWRKGWYTEREEVIMVNRILRDDPAKGLTLLHEPATLLDIKAAWTDPSMWGLYLIGLIAYIPASPVQAYLTLTLKRLGFTTFASNMLTVPSAVLQILTMFALAYSSDYFNERTLHCIVGEFWLLPLLTALLTLPDGGREWDRFSLITLISGYPYFHPLVSAWISENAFDVRKRAVTAATYNVIVQIGSLVGSQIYRKWDGPYYKQGNTVLVAICGLSLVVFAVQRVVLVRLNGAKERVWRGMTGGERAAYQADIGAREGEGNRRLDFRFKL